VELRKERKKEITQVSSIPTIWHVSSWQGWLLGAAVLAIYKGHLQSSWTHFITPSWNFVEVQWWSLFWSTSLGKQCTSYNTPSTSWKYAADWWSLQNFLHWSSLFMIGKAQKSYEARPGLYGRCSKGVPPIHFFQAEHRIQFRSCPMWFLGFSNNGKGALRQEILKWWTVCSTFLRRGWRVVRSAELAKEGTSKKRSSPYLHKVLTQSKKVNPQTLQMALLYLLLIMHCISRKEGRKERKIQFTNSTYQPLQFFNSLFLCTQMLQFILKLQSFSCKARFFHDHPCILKDYIS
jgi:hypothetical protein